MKTISHFAFKFISTVTILSFMVSVLSGCNLSFSFDSTSTPTPEVTGTPQPTATPPPLKAEITFEVIVPKMAARPSIDLEILDEVTGLALNAAVYKMNATDDTHFSLKLPLSVGAVIRYRYVREGKLSAIEYTPTNQQVRYRLFFVTGPNLVRDLVGAWNDQHYEGETGRITGKVIDAATRKPVPSLLIVAGGMQTLTTSDGSYLLEGLQPGTHNLVAYSLDGSYRVYQQGATIQAQATTPAPLSLSSAPLVKVTFNLTIPPEVLGVPIRLAGNLYQLGNTFADLRGGISGLASRMPVMAPAGERKYTLTLNLPAGTDLEYKYTLGDGFWNAEQTSEGRFYLRQLIVPEKDVVLEETVETWKSGDSAPITFEVKTPVTTPSQDSVSIQFNPYGWTEPLPMWSVGKNHWLYILYGPFNMLGKMAYRYCRNDQCGFADDKATQGPNPSGWPVGPSLLPQSFQDEVSSWAWWQPSDIPTAVVSAEIKPRGSDFVAGFEFQSGYHPSWQSHYLSALQNIRSIGSNWVFLTPTWTYTRNNPPIIEPVTGRNALWPDLLETFTQARAIGLNLAVFPQPSFTIAEDQWWQTAQRDFSWWQVWFERYTQFIDHYTDLATVSGAKMLVLGGDWLLPALPSGKLKDGSPSKVPADAELRWRQLFKDIRGRFNGKIYWAMSSTLGMKTPPPFLDAVDGIYLIFSSGIANSSNPSEIELENGFAQVLDQDVQNFQASLMKPLILAPFYPSVDGSASACPASAQGACLTLDQLNTPGLDISGVALDLQEQVDIYNALLNTVNQREWISGIVSRGYYPPVALQDKSASLHGKPAFDVLWYWFPKLTGK